MPTAFEWDFLSVLFGRCVRIGVNTYTLTAPVVESTPFATTTPRGSDNLALVVEWSGRQDYSACGLTPSGPPAGR